MRKQAILWWNDLDTIKKESISIDFYQRKYASLTGSEIEKIYEKKDTLINDLMCQTSHCDDITAKQIVDKYIIENKQILLFYDLSFLYKI